MTYVLFFVVSFLRKKYNTFKNKKDSKQSSFMNGEFSHDFENIKDGLCSSNFSHFVCKIITYNYMVFS